MRVNAALPIRASTTLSFSIASAGKVRKYRQANATGEPVPTISHPTVFWVRLFCSNSSFVGIREGKLSACWLNAPA